MVDSLAPGLLIAVPHLLDPNFRQAVVLLLEAGDDGAMGVIVNRESSLLLHDLCQDHDIRYAGESAKRVRRGGPVRPDHGLVLFGPEHADPAGQPVSDGLFVSTSHETLSRLCHLSSGRFHCYAGFAGWGPGQLEREIREGAWITAPVNAAHVLDAPPAEIWRRSFCALGIDPATIVPGSAASA